MQDGMGEDIPLIDGCSVDYSVTRVHHDARGKARVGQGQDGHMAGMLNVSNMMSHLPIAGIGVQGKSFSEHGMHLGVATHNLLSKVFCATLVGDYAVLNGVLQSQDAAFALSLITHVRVILAHAHHLVLVPWDMP